MTTRGQCTNFGYCAFPDTSCSSGLRYHQSAGELANVCVGQEGTAKGDTPMDPMPLGEMQSLDLAGFDDDIETSCGRAGGHDAFFETTLAMRSRLYVDTLGSDFHVVLAVFRGACAGRSGELDCLANSCGESLQHWSDVLDPGTYCIVADQFDDTQTSAHLVVRSMIGPESPAVNVGATMSGNTCKADNWRSPCPATGPEQLPDETWFAMTCTTTSVTMSTCQSDPSFDGDLFVSGFAKSLLACDNGCPGVTVMIPAGPAWFVAEAGGSSTCGLTAVELGAN